jgi:hypothetical protein
MQSSSEVHQVGAHLESIPKQGAECCQGAIEQVFEVEDEPIMIDRELRSLGVDARQYRALSISVRGCFLRLAARNEIEQ